MGLFDFFGGKGGGKASKVDKIVKKVTNPYLQTAERIRFMHTLAEMRTDESLYGLLQRFSMRTDKTILDEDEKQLGYRLLVDAGVASIEPIRRYISENDTVYYPFKALREVAGLDSTVKLLLGVLDRASAKDQRVNDQREQLIATLRDFEHPDIRARLVLLGEDASEDVRVQALDALMAYGSDAALEAIVGRLLNPDESLRVKAVLYEQLIEHEWSVAAWRDGFEVDGAMPRQYRLDGAGRIARS